jgi:hypothetical protein
MLHPYGKQCLTESPQSALGSMLVPAIIRIGSDLLISLLSTGISSIAMNSIAHTIINNFK